MGLVSAGSAACREVAAGALSNLAARDNKAGAIKKAIVGAGGVQPLVALLKVPHFEIV